MLKINVKRTYPRTFDAISLYSFFVKEGGSAPSLYFKLDAENARNITEGYNLKLTSSEYKYFVVVPTEINMEVV